MNARTSTRALSIVSSFVVATGCATIHPPGWEARDQWPKTTAVAAPGPASEGSGEADHWLSPFGEIEILTAAAGDPQFEVRLRTSTELGLTCRSNLDASAGGPFAGQEETQGATFGCVSYAGDVALGLGAGCSQASESGLAACRRGVLRLGRDTFVLELGHATDTAEPLGYASLLGPGDSLFAAAEIEPKARLNLWIGASPDGDRLQQTLLLVFTALHRFQHHARI